MTTLSKSFQSPHPLLFGLVTSALATAASYLVPDAHAGEAVGFVFLAATYLGCLRPDQHLSPEHFGLRLGGVLDPGPLVPSRMFKETARAFVISSCVALLILPPFFFGFVLWYEPHGSWQWSRALTDDLSTPFWFVFNLSLSHVLVVALPEEAFFRGYLQTALGDRYCVKKRLLGIDWSLALFASSALFALGHLTTTPDPARLAVFFPSLLFGVLRDKTGGIGASVFLHAQCNIFAALLGRGYGLH